MPVIVTVKGYNESKMKEKNSLFIAQVYPLMSESEAEEILKKTRKTYYDASHHCYCYKLQNGKFHYSDDGEPSGTAGIRIMSAIDHHKLTDLLLIVIRYFGGVKLGTGPLGKAYYEAASSVLNEKIFIEKKGYKRINFSTSFDNVNHIYRVLNEGKAKNINTNYGQTVNISACVLTEEVEHMSTDITELTKGKVDIVIDPKELYF